MKKIYVESTDGLVLACGDSLRAEKEALKELCKIKKSRPYAEMKEFYVDKYLRGCRRYLSDYYDEGLIL